MVIMTSGIARGRVHTTTTTTTATTTGGVTQDGGHPPNNRLTGTWRLGLQCTSLTLDIHVIVTCRAKWLNADWLRQRIFFLNQEGTFGYQEGMITWSWLAEHACIKLVSGFKRILKRNFRNASLLSLILTRPFHLNAKGNQHATKRSHLVEKPKDFSDQKRIDSQGENSSSGDGWRRTKH